MSVPSADIYPAIAAEIALISDDTPVVCQQLSGADKAIDAVKATGDLSQTWVIGIPELGAQLEELLACQELTLFAVDELPGHVFATNGQLAAGKSRVLAKAGELGSPAPEQLAPSQTAETPRVVTKFLETPEERFVLGVVLVPEVTDSQGDIYSHGEVRKAAHAYMERSGGTLGKQHSEIVTGKLKVLENYVAPVDFEIGGETVTAGTWLMGIRVVDDDLWTAVKSGSFTGFSIGGSALRRPETD